MSNSSPPSQQRKIRQTLLASLIGTSIEWYDFFIFGIASTVVLNKLFFPQFEPLVGTLIALSVFGSAYLARPIGAIVFGHLGDRLGRKSTLVITLSLMGCGTFLIGLLPTYSAIGITAPFLLVALRLGQGLAVGGEWGGAALIAVEHAPHGKRGIYGSVANMGSPLGFILGTGVFTLVLMLPDEALLTWGWRVPFLASALLLAIGMYIRFRIDEPPEFDRIASTHTQARLPIIEVLRRPKNVLLAVLLLCGQALPSSIYGFFASTYIVQELKLPASVGTTGVMIASVLGLIILPISATLSDRFGRRRIYILGAIYSAIVALPVFWLFDTRQPTMIWLAFVLGLAIGTYTLYGPMVAYFAELFGTRTRYTGISLGYQLGASVFSGFGPMFATALLVWSGGASWPIAVLIMAAAAVSALAASLTPVERQPRQSELTETVS